MNRRATPTTRIQDETLDWFRTLRPLDVEEMVGLWRGHTQPSGHPLDGVLESLGWFGKRFHDDLRADALLFQRSPGRLLAVEPAIFPIRLAIRLARFGRSRLARNLFDHIAPRFRARGPTETIRPLLEGDIFTAAMVYDRQSVTDFFRRLDEREVIGMMAVDSDPRRFFFRLTKIG